MKTNLKIRLNSSTIKENVNHPDTQWLKPSEVAELTGFDVKWLAAAREGRKGITEPPFIKIGSGKTSPIRYPLGELTTWMNSFPIYSSNSSSHLSFSDFQKSSNPMDVWPFVLYEDGTFEEIFESINKGKFKEQYLAGKLFGWPNALYL